MSRTDDIQNLEKSITEAYAKMITVLSNIEAISKEIDLLSNKEKELEENIKYLKEKKIVTVAQEFKKSKQDLKKISSKISILDSDKKHFLKVSQSIQEFIDKIRIQIEKMEYINTNNVIQFKKRDKK